MDRNTAINHLTVALGNILHSIKQLDNHIIRLEGYENTNKAIVATNKAIVLSGWVKEALDTVSGMQAKPEQAKYIDPRQRQGGTWGT